MVQLNIKQKQLENFKRQFNNSISSTKNAWRTPILAGLDDVQWISMAGSAKEMEYLTYNQHVMRALCSQFQIDPMELGLEFLSNGSGVSGAGQQSNETKLSQSKERGLKPLLMFFEDFINRDIIPLLDPQFGQDYEFKFVGIDDETPQTKIALQQAEMTVHASLNDLLSTAGKTMYDDKSADLPLNSSFWDLVEKNYTRGEIREKFFGDKGASKRTELKYIPNDPGFMAYQQLLLQIATQKQATKQQDEQMKTQNEQMQQQQEQQMQQLQQQSQAEQQTAEQEQQAAEEEKQYQRQLEQAKAQREQEKHEADMKEIKDRRYNAAMNNKPLK